MENFLQLRRGSEGRLQTFLLQHSTTLAEITVNALKIHWGGLEKEVLRETMSIQWQEIGD